MAGVDPNAGTTVTYQTVPSIGGPAKIVSGGNIVASGAPSYNTDVSIGVGGPDGNGYPAGTAMKDNTPSDNVN